MDTAHKSRRWPRARPRPHRRRRPQNYRQRRGDSEFKLVDHTPGYGSTAKYWMHMVQNANQEMPAARPPTPSW